MPCDECNGEHDAALELLDEQLEINEQLKGRLAGSLKAARALDKVAGELGIGPEYRDDAYVLAGLSGGDFSEEEGAAKLRAFIAERPHWARGSGPAGDGKLSVGGRKTADDLEGLRAPKPETPKRRVTHDQLNDWDWVRNNRATLEAPGSYEIVPG